MKYLLFLMAMMLGSLCSYAQFEKPVTWKYTITEDTIPNQYILEAKAILQSGWHIFTNEPGGDGLLMATTFDIDADSSITHIGDIELAGKVIKKEFEGVGLVNYFEGEGIFRRTVTMKEKVDITGTMHYQICNDEMCLPPAEDLFIFKP